jgi:hypothetical protein
MSRQHLPADFGAYHAQHLAHLASRPNTSVLQVEHENVREPWKVERVRAILGRIRDRMRDTTDCADDFALRSSLMQNDPEVVAFQRAHPQLFHAATTRATAEQFTQGIDRLLRIRQDVEWGRMSEADANAMATAAVLSPEQQHQHQHQQQRS